MNKNSYRSSRVRYLALLLWVVISPGSLAGICSEIESKKSFTNSDRITSGYFDEYFIRERNDVYFIYTSKQVQVDFAAAARVMNDLESHPNFIPGYQSIKVLRGPDGEILTGIRLRAAFSPFSSRFTNEVDISNEQGLYKQCWEQLKAEDGRVIEEPKNAPHLNMGYWWFEKISESEVKIHYFSVIKPPLAIPSWLYISIARGSYEDLFDRIIKRIRLLSDNALLDEEAMPGRLVNPRKKSFLLSQLLCGRKRYSVNLP